MKNLFLIAIACLVFSCGGDTKTENNTTKTAAQPTKTEEIQPTSAVETPPSESVEETKMVETKVVNEAVETEKPASKITTKVPAKNTTSVPVVTSKLSGEKPSANTVVKNAAEAKAQIEAEKAKALADKMHVEEEMKKVETDRKAKALADAKIKKEMELKKAAADKAKNEVAKPAPTANLHDRFDALLRKHVSSTGKVSYKGFKSNEAKLDAYLKTLEKIDVKNLSRKKALAFWINAYNAYTIKLILKNYPVKSIMDLHNGKPWDAKWIKLDERTLSLNNIENDIIRPKFNEPRIHFAVNCAAKSCPPLLNKAWTASNLNSNFERQTKAFVNNANYNSISADNVEASKIFDWYGKDFGDLKAFLNKYSNTKIGDGTSINFKSYNWELNN